MKTDVERWQEGCFGSKVEKQELVERSHERNDSKKSRIVQVLLVCM